MGVGVGLGLVVALVEFVPFSWDELESVIQLACFSDCSNHPLK